MSDKSNQQISNLMDGELELNASQFLLKRMASDKSLSKTWESYHLIKSCLQKESQEPLLIDVASQVCAKLGLQHDETVVKQPVVNRWLKPLMGLSIAASVAFMSVMMIQNQQIDDLQPKIEGSLMVESGVNPSFNPSIQPNITASMANGNTSLVSPPALLSRFPSASANNSYGYTQGFSNNVNMPYILIINQSSHKKHLSPMKIKDLSD